MLYIVGTPIGNLSEVTYRAVEVLKSVDYIACEDTRTSSVFLKHYNINKPLVSYHKFNEKTMLPRLVKDLSSGKNIALISDAGMPGISDPGNMLINSLIAKGLDYTVISGPSAVINAFILSGYKTPFTFIGFLPDKKSELINALKEYRTYRTTLVFYVAPHDLHQTIDMINQIFGDRSICVVREISKKFEAVSFSTLEDGYNGSMKGEFVLLVEGYVGENKLLSSLTIENHILYYLRQGLTKEEAIKRVVKDRKIKKNEVYQVMIKLEGRKDFKSLSQKPVAKIYKDCEGNKIDLITLSEESLIRYVENALYKASEARSIEKYDFENYLLDAQNVVEHWVINQMHYNDQFGKSGFYRISNAGLRKIIDVICNIEITVDVGFLAELFNTNDYGLKLDSGEVDLVDEIKANRSVAEINNWKQRLLKRIDQMDKTKKDIIMTKTFSK